MKLAAQWGIVVGWSCSAVLAATEAGGSAGFQTLGYLDSKAVPSGSLGTGISADGTIVVGTSWFFDGEFTETRAFRWTQSDGMQNLGVPPNSLSSSMGGRVSNDGQVIAGSIGFAIAPYFEIRNAAAWNLSRQADGVVLPDGLTSSDVTANGKMVVGATRVPGPWPIPDQAFRWSLGHDPQKLGLLPGGSYSWASAVSANGSVIVGFGDLPGQVTAFRWTLAGGMQPLAGQPDKVPSQANGITPDSQIIVGYLGNEAMYWSDTTGFVNIGLLDGAGFSNANDVSADGQVIVGYNYYDGPTVGFVWDPVRGMRSVTQALEGEGIDLGGFQPEWASGISDDGRIIVGWGLNSDGIEEAFLATLPRIGDIDDTGVVNGADLGLLLAAWGSDNAPADLNDDGVVDGSDLGLLLAAWNS